MNRSRTPQGFSLVELLLVLAILGIISAIAIPSFMGQRRRARIIGDAKTNAAVLRMAMETRKADAGVYGAANASFVWTNTTSPATSVNPAPSFSATANNTTMNYSIVVGSLGITYVLTVNDRSMSGAKVFQTNQNGSNLYTMQ